MNKIVKFFHELRYPHCVHCINEMELRSENEKFCRSCESLASENSRLVRENERLLDLVIDSCKAPNIDKSTNINETNELKPIRTSSHIPWNVRRQQIETEKRAELVARRNAAKPDVKEELKELEKELNEVERARTN